MSEIKREITDRFLSKYEMGGVAYDVMYNLMVIYALYLDFYEPSFEPQQTEYFDFSPVMAGRKSPIIAEIEGNLNLLAGDERERYLFSLLTPFRFLTEECRPVAKRSEKTMRTEAERQNYRCVEAYYFIWDSAAKEFADRLDALLLTYGIDLLQLQETSGIYLKERREIYDVDYYIGSEALARHYIDALPQRESVQGGRALPVELETERARKYFARAVDAGLMTEQFEWLKSKALLARFCAEMSDSLNLGKGSSSDGVRRICWRPFEGLFSIGGDSLKRNSLRASLNDIRKTGSEPVGIEQVKNIFSD